MLLLLILPFSSFLLLPFLTNMKTAWQCNLLPLIGIFENNAKIPAEYILLLASVQSALNRIESSYRKNAIGAYKYLLAALFSPLQKFLTLETIDSQIFVSKVAADSSSARVSWKSFRSRKARMVHKDRIKYVVIPSSDEVPYEKEVMGWLLL